MSCAFQSKHCLSSPYSVWITTVDIFHITFFFIHSLITNPPALQLHILITGLQLEIYIPLLVGKPLLIMNDEVKLGDG